MLLTPKNKGNKNKNKIEQNKTRFSFFLLSAFREMEAIGWSHFDIKNEPGNVAFMAANTMSKIAAMYEDAGKFFWKKSEQKLFCLFIYILNSNNIKYSLFHFRNIIHIMVIIAEENNEDQKQVSTKTNKKERKRKDGKNGKKALKTEENLSFLPSSGVDIELSNESKQKLRKRSDYKIRLKYSENNGKRLDFRI